MLKGIVYVLTNDAMPNFIKIGITTTSIEQRLRELDTTSVPVPFRCHFAIEVEDYKQVEKLIHDAFDNHRVRPNREFFELSPERAVSALKLTRGNEIKISDDAINEEGKAVAIRPRTKKRFPFDLAEIPVGSEIKFIRDESKTAKVLPNHNVEFEGEEYSLTKLATKLLAELGYNWKAVQGPAYFTYEGEILSERRNRLEQGDEEE